MLLPGPMAPPISVPLQALLLCSYPYCCCLPPLFLPLSACPRLPPLFLPLLPPTSSGLSGPSSRGSPPETCGRPRAAAEADATAATAGLTTTMAAAAAAAAGGRCPLTAVAWDPPTGLSVCSPRGRCGGEGFCLTSLGGLPGRRATVPPPPLLSAAAAAPSGGRRPRLGASPPSIDPPLPLSSPLSSLPPLLLRPPRLRLLPLSESLPESVAMPW